jgi:hypothetical protein
MRDGRYAAGRVLAVPAFGPSDRRGMVVALLDWTGDQPPTAEQITGRPVLATAKTRVEAIRNTGRQILGNRPLESDGIVPPVESFQVGEKSNVWGWRTIVNRAERHYEERA